MVVACLLVTASSTWLGPSSFGNPQLGLNVTVAMDGSLHAAASFVGHPWARQAENVRRIDVDPALELLTPQREISEAFAGGGTVAFELKFRVRDCRLLPLAGDPLVTVHLGSRWRTSWKIDLALIGVGAAAPPVQPTKVMGSVSPHPTTGPGQPAPQPPPVTVENLALIC